MPRKTKTSTAAKSAKEAPAVKAKKSVTQSTRFGAEQMREIEKACKTKGWSVAKLMQIATLEKALAVNQVHERRSDVAGTARELARVLLGPFPRVTVNNRQLLCPGEFGSEWQPDDERDAGDMCVQLGDASPMIWASYDHSAKTVTVTALYQEGDEPTHEGADKDLSSVEIEINAPLPGMVERILETISAVGPEIVQLVADNYRELQRHSEGEDEKRAKFKTVRDLLDEEERKR